MGDERRTADHVAEIARRGFTVLDGVLSDAGCDELLDDLDRLHRELDVRPAANDFEGTATLRVYNLLAHGVMWQRLATDERVLAVVDRVLGPGCLVSSLSSIAIGAGETAQPIHADDQLIPIPKPHPPTVCNSMWALTPFTEANGATRLIEGTHLWDHSPNYGQHYDSVPAEMQRGSVLVWHGSLWHGGGANLTDARRVGIAMNYCAGYVRQQENQQLGLDPALVATFEPRLQELVGYGVYQGLIGHIERASPQQRFFGERPDGRRMVWDAGER